ncbi:MAG: hypothetical protein O7H39_08990 [Gammaproteobacteria bacterium]|nr:hypothetical protein [Gammaproteobacteria bacterium]
MKETDHLDFAKAREFIYTSARRVDRAIFETLFESADRAHVLAALGAYRNSDGGFGHALEADLRGPSSETLHTEAALGLLREAGVREPQWATAACGFLSSIADVNHALPMISAASLEYRAASHWTAAACTPDFARTYGLVALLRWHGAEHDWVDAASGACAARLPADRLEDAHTLVGAIRFAREVMADDKLVGKLLNNLTDAPYFIKEPPIDRYALTPLHFAASPDADPGFGKDTIDRHLDWLAGDQQDDGGWPVRFQPVGPAAEFEWRGRFAVEALSTLRAWGRL